MKRNIILLVASICICLLFASCMTMKGESKVISVLSAEEITTLSRVELPLNNLKAVATITVTQPIADQDYYRNSRISDWMYNSDLIDIFNSDVLGLKVPFYYQSENHDYALACAIQKMIIQAQDVGAAFLSYPSYSIFEDDSGKMVLRIQATAFAFVESDGSSLPVYSK